jgi:hypothetical protein
MKASSTMKFEMENFKGIFLNCEQDCTLGTLYDFSCHLQSFILNKMKEIEQQKTIQQDSQSATETVI